MCHTIGVQIVERSCNLVTQLFGALFTYRKLTPFEIAKQVTAVQLLHHNVDIVLVFEDIEESDNVGMLAHFENLNFSPLQFDILNGHLLLGHDLNRDSLSSLPVDSTLYKTKFALAKSFLDFVIVEHV